MCICIIELLFKVSTTTVILTSVGLPGEIKEHNPNYIIFVGSTQQAFDRYDSKGKRRALMLCIKKDHIGADSDLEIMKKLFQDYGFLWEIVINKTAKVSFHVYLFTSYIK